MPSIPKTFYRKTKHKKPRHQLYYPGFNPANGCWLDGGWVTVSEAEWKARHKAHHKQFKAATKGRGKQHYRDDGIPLDQLSEAQRLAYNHYSGQVRVEVQYENGFTGGAGIDMAGNKPRPDQVKWMRGQGMKIIRFTKNGHTGETTDTLEGYEFPDDLIGEGKAEDAMDPWIKVVNQNKQREQDMFEAYLEGAGDEEQPEAMRGMMAGMAFTCLTMKEKSIIRTKWDVGRGGNDPYADLDRDVREYVDMRTKLETTFGEHFNGWYQSRRDTHNECARANLGDHGTMYCFVLPTFNADGSHDPWGPRDVPWGVEA